MAFKVFTTFSFKCERGCHGYEVDSHFSEQNKNGMSDRVTSCDIQKRRVSSITNVKNRKTDIFQPTSEKSLYL